ncbi:MAG: glycosyl transferase family 4, partial [bacterium]
VLFLSGLVGVIDDLLGWKNGGLSKKFRLFLALIASIPLVVINAGSSSISIPFIGSISIGILYPLVLIPLAIVGASTTFNFLAGFNGVEAGQGILILGFLSLVAYATGIEWLAFIGMLFVISLLGFLIFNFYPAKVFPGDILTYSTGAMIAIMAIVGNFEKIALFVFIPYILEVGLKSRGKLKVYSFGIPNKNNSLKMPKNKVYGLTHLAMFILSKFKTKVSEKQVVYFIWLIQIIFILLAMLIWFPL